MNRKEFRKEEISDKRTRLGAEYPRFGDERSVPEIQNCRRLLVLAGTVGTSRGSGIQTLVHLYTTYLYLFIHQSLCLLVCLFITYMF